MADGLLDEPRDEEGSEMSTHSLERCYEILAVVEGLGFHGCRVEVCPVRGGARDLMGGDGNKTWKLRFGYDLFNIKFNINQYNSEKNDLQ